jgi:hypothetical protein
MLLPFVDRVPSADSAKRGLANRNRVPTLIYSIVFATEAERLLATDGGHVRDDLQKESSADKLTARQDRNQEQMQRSKQ